MEDALIIFVRNPELGKVKTRIAAAVGNETALNIYKKLLQHTHQTIDLLECEKYIFYAESINENDMWNGEGCNKKLQQNLNLGLRMQAAFTEVSTKGHNKACIIGSDCLELTTGIIQEAFDLLDHNEIVIGPAKDGGYYLLGMKGQVYPIFSGIDWSTEKVLQQTLQIIQQQGYPYALLTTLSDVDTIEDVPLEWKTELNITTSTI